MERGWKVRGTAAEWENWTDEGGSTQKREKLEGFFSFQSKIDDFYGQRRAPPLFSHMQKLIGAYLHSFGLHSSLQSIVEIWKRSAKCLRKCHNPVLYLLRSPRGILPPTGSLSGKTC